MLLGLGCAGVLYLFFVPNSSLFNITYINYNIKKETSKYSSANISTIELNSRAYEIEILQSEDDNVYLKARATSFGFVNVKNKDFSIQSNLRNSTLTINIIEPHGFATSNLSSLKLYVPAEKNQGTIMTIRHKGNQELYISQLDAAREFLLKVIEIVCAGGEFHKQNNDKTGFFS